MICIVCDEMLSRDENPLRMFGGYAHQECDILDIRENVCADCWLIHAGECP